MPCSLTALYFGAGGERDQFRVLIFHVYCLVVLDCYQLEVIGILTTDLLTCISRKSTGNNINKASVLLMYPCEP